MLELYFLKECECAVYLFLYVTSAFLLTDENDSITNVLRLVQNTINESN